jgi:hypothetical protein
MANAVPLFIGEVQMKVLRKSDRVKFKIDEVEFTIAPLSYRDRIELSTSVKSISGEAVSNYLEQTLMMIKKCLKDIAGLKDYDGKEYFLSFNEDKLELTDICSDELLMCFQNSKAVTALVQSSMGNLEGIDGVEFTVLGKS